MGELRRLHRAGRRAARALVGAALILVAAAIGSIWVVLHESRVELAATRAALDRSARAHGRALETTWARDRKALSDLLERGAGVTSDSVRARE